MGTGTRRQPRSDPRPAIVPPRTAASIRGLLWPYAAIFAAAVILRLLYVASIRHTYFFAHLQTEPLRYWQWGTLMLDGTAPPPPYDEPPGYAGFVAAIFALFGRDVAAVAHAQGVLDALSCALVAALGTHWFGKRAGIIAGIMAAAYGPFVYFSGELLPNSLLIAVVVGAIAAAALPRMARSQTVGVAEQPRWLLSGILWALALTVRFEIIAAYPFVVFDAWRRGRGRGLIRAAAPTALVFMALTGHGVCSSWPKLLNSTAGLNLWIGNNPDSDGVNPFIFGLLQPQADRIVHDAGTGAAADRAFGAAAITFWVNQPRAALRLLWKKFVWTWANRELPNTSDIDWQTTQSWLFRSPLFPLSFGMVLPLALAGGLLAAGKLRQLPLLIGLLVTGTLVPVLLFTNARFRLIMAPALILLGGFSGAYLQSLLRAPSRHRGPFLRAGAGMVIGLIVAWGNFFDVRAYQIPQLAVNTGVLERGAGQYSAAVAHLRAGLAEDPTDALAWVQLALALEQEGQRRAALQAYLDGLAHAPEDGTLPRVAAWFVQRQQLDSGLIDGYRHAETPAARQAAAEAALRAFDARDISRRRPD